jgi:hypothetical protein
MDDVSRCKNMAELESGAIRLGRILKNIRLENGFDLRGFADLCVKDDGKKIGFSTLQKAEVGKAPNAEVLRAIARNPYISKLYTFSQLCDFLANDEDNPLAERKISSAHQVLPYINDLPESQKKELSLAILEMLVERDSKMEILQSLLDSFTHPPKGRKRA